MMSVNFAFRVTTFALLLSVSGCVTGDWDVTDDPALPETGWTKNRVYQLQARLFIYQYVDGKDLFLDSPRPIQTRVEPGSKEEFHEQRNQFGGDAIGVLEKGSLVRFTAISLRRNWESGDFLKPYAQILTGQFTGRLVDLISVSLIESAHAYTHYESARQTSMADVLRRNPKVFLPVEAK